MSDWIESSHELCHGYNLIRPIYDHRSKRNVLQGHGHWGCDTHRNELNERMGNSAKIAPHVGWAIAQRLRPMLMSNGTELADAPHVDGK